MRIMSIIGIVWFSLSLICVLAFYNSDLGASAGWGMLGLLYAIPYSIVGLVKTKPSSRISSEELIHLHELKEKQILSESEFNAKKSQFLSQ
jgi:hypothetical protein